MKCMVCDSEDVKLIFKKHQGYVKGTYYDIFKCLNCGTHFIDKFKLDKKVYDQIYSSGSTPGYDRYYKYANQIKSQTDPLAFLSSKEYTYYPIKEYLKNKKKLNILEAGCGYGYLTYAMNKAGHNIIGIDISKNAIKFARSQFGNYFLDEDIEKFSSKINKKFDLIVATELIEHLTEPTSFIASCLKLLSHKGKIIVTTPNKDYYGKDVLWHAEYPPVHTVLLGKSSMEKIAELTNSKLEFFDLTPYFKEHYNNLITLILSRKEKVLTSYHLDENIQPNEEFFKRKKSFKKRFLTIILKDFSLARNMSNFIHYLITKDDSAICVMYSKK